MFLDTKKENYLFNPIQNQRNQAKKKHWISKTAKCLSKTTAGQKSVGGSVFLVQLSSPSSFYFIQMKNFDLESVFIHKCCFLKN